MAFTAFYNSTKRLTSPLKKTIIEGMKTQLNLRMVESVQNFHLPKYSQLPDMGLYLEQTTKYINQCLAPLGCAPITSSMIRNYVKMDLVHHPIRKQYFADQIAHLIAITILKMVIPLEHISKLFIRQQAVYTDQVAYDYFCQELENILYYRCGLKETIDQIGQTVSVEKEMLRSAITAVSHVIFLNACMQELGEESTGGDHSE